MLMESNSTSSKRTAEAEVPETSSKVTKTAEGSRPSAAIIWDAAASTSTQLSSQQQQQQQQQQQHQQQQQQQQQQAPGPALRLRHAVSAGKGTRITMEDVHVCLNDNDGADDDAPAGTSNTRVSYFAIYDGHGGADCAHYVAERLHEAVLAAGLLTQKKVQPSAKSNSRTSLQDAAAAAAVQPCQLDIKAAKQAIIKGFTRTDELLLKECAQHNWQDGATAVAVWVVGETALVANVGDAKCVLARTSDKAGSVGQLRALVLTKDHLALHAAERARIEKAGGHVTADGRLNGRIQVSRAFGDAQFKGFGSSASPDVTAFTITHRDEFMLCACDGCWGVLDPQGAVDLVQQQLQAGRDVKAVTNRLLNEAVQERRCKDNCTVMLIRFEGRQQT